MTPWPICGAVVSAPPRERLVNLTPVSALNESRLPEADTI